MFAHGEKGTSDHLSLLGFCAPSLTIFLHFLGAITSEAFGGES